MITRRVFDKGSFNGHSPAGRHARNDRRPRVRWTRPILALLNGGHLRLPTYQSLSHPFGYRCAVLRHDCGLRVPRKSPADTTTGQSRQREAHLRTTGTGALSARSTAPPRIAVFDRDPRVRAAARTAVAPGRGPLAGHFHGTASNRWLVRHPISQAIWDLLIRPMERDCFFSSIAFPSQFRLTLL
jgi:hypothetical protein